jgi:hypothetical protein
MILPWIRFRTISNFARLDVLLSVAQDAGAVPAERRKAASGAAEYFLPKQRNKKKSRRGKYRPDEYGFSIDPRVASLVCHEPAWWAAPFTMVQHPEQAGRATGSAWRPLRFKPSGPCRIASAERSPTAEQVGRLARQPAAPDPFAMSDQTKPHGFKTLAAAMAAIKDFEGAKRRQVSETPWPKPDRLHLLSFRKKYEKPSPTPRR